jgi:hypothetical protein
VPGGVPPDGDETVAVKVTGLPSPEGFTEEIKVVAVSNVPTPLSENGSGLSGAPSVMLTVAILVPLAVGVKVTLMEQL